MKSTNLYNRIQIGIIGVLLIAICTVYSLQFSFLFAIIWVLCAIEVGQILNRIHHKKYTPIQVLIWILFSLLLSFILFVSYYSVHGCISSPYTFSIPPILPILCLVLLLILWLFSVSQLFFHVQKKLVFYTGAIYLAIPSTLTILIRFFYGWEYIALLFLGTWSMDIFSYIFGMTLGKHKIAPTLSPKKSWEGFIGGSIGSMVCFLLFFYFLIPHPITVATWIFSLLLPIISFFGDLFQSKLKRLAQVKDSGNILQGHGGVWDRFDGLLFYALGFGFYLLVVFP
jgi:phosphatidate cytidylyltransferase